jgi:cytochrome c biogenesis protein CcmG, thiol:disulfide interchange protein DsbE
MKKLLFPLMVLFVELSYGQTNYYTFNSDSILTEKGVRLVFETFAKNLPANFTFTPTIYHRIVKEDSIINYLSFAERCDSCTSKKFEFTFKQDSLFLLLDKKLPEFKLMDLNGNEFSSSQLIGKPTLLNYWAINCAPCVAEMPELNELKEKYGDKMNFIALTENTCQHDDLIKFLEKHPFNYYILQNAENYKKALKISSIPRNLFIDKEGYIRYIQGNFPYTAFDSQKGIKKFNDNNYFVRIIEGLIVKQ